MERNQRNCAARAAQGRAGGVWRGRRRHRRRLPRRMAKDLPEARKALKSRSTASPRCRPDPTRADGAGVHELILDLPWTGDRGQSRSFPRAKCSTAITTAWSVKARIVEPAVRSLPHSQGRSLCLVGPPGVGKTSIVRGIAGMGRSSCMASAACTTRPSARHRRTPSAQPPRDRGHAQGRLGQPRATFRRDRQARRGRARRPRVGHARCSARRTFVDPSSRYRTISRAVCSLPPRTTRA